MLPSESDAIQTSGDSGATRPAAEDGTGFRDLARALVASASCADAAGVEDAGNGFRQQQANLSAWAHREGRSVSDAELEALPLLSNSTSEHEVRVREADGRVVKRTWPGFYGQVPLWRNGKLDRGPATPAQYLERMALHNEVFASAFWLEGVNESNRPSMIIGEASGQPSLVISQPKIAAVDARFPTPSISQIDEFLRAYEFQPVLGSYFGWQRRDGAVLLDARSDNFIVSAEGVIPIDLQMAQFGAAL